MGPMYGLLAPGNYCYYRSDLFRREAADIYLNPPSGPFAPRKNTACGRDAALNAAAKRRLYPFARHSDYWRPVVIFNISARYSCSCIRELAGIYLRPPSGPGATRRYVAGRRSAATRAAAKRRYFLSYRHTHHVIPALTDRRIARKVLPPRNVGYIHAPAVRTIGARD